MNIVNKRLASILLILVFQGCNSDNDSESSNRFDDALDSVVETTTYNSPQQEVIKAEKDLISDSYKIEKNLISKKEFHLKTVKNISFTVVKEGTKFTIQNLDKRVVLFDFFTTWCPACRSVAPHLANIQDKYKKEMLVLGVLIEDGKSDQDVIRFKEKYKAHYPISNATDKDSNYANFKLSNEIAKLLRQPRSFPIPLLVMFKDGKYFTHYVGAVPEEMIESDIKEALGLRGDN